MGKKGVSVKHVMLALSVLGIIVAGYLVLVHYAGIPLVCSDQGIINCNNVLTSQYATLLGVPVAVFGLVFFVIEIAVVSYFKNKDWVLLYNALGMAFVGYLLYAEYMVGNICVYCTAVHVITLALFILSFFENERIVL